MTNYEKIKQQIIDGNINTLHNIITEPVCSFCVHHMDYEIEYIDVSDKQTKKSACYGLATNSTHEHNCYEGVLKYLQQEAKE